MPDGEADDTQVGDAIEDEFNDLMSDLDHPMVIVTTAVDAVRAGCLVGFHSQSGMEPPRYSIWLSKANHTYRIGVLADRFAVHFPALENRDLAELFGTKTGDEIDKFAQCSWTEGPGGVPLLDDCPDRLVGHRIALLDPGADHVCITLEPIEVTTIDDHPPGWRRLLLSDVLDLDAGHEADERQTPD